MSRLSENCCLDRFCGRRAKSLASYYSCSLLYDNSSSRIFWLLFFCPEAFAIFVDDFEIFITIFNSTSSMCDVLITFFSREKI